MFRIADGRECFYQWDINRQVIVEDPTITEVHFCNRTDECSLVVKVYADPLDSEIKADVPNILLQNDYPIRVYAYCNDGYTKIERVFKVKSRTKPSDYVYTETEVLQFSTISQRIDDIEQNIGTEVQKYMEENPVSVDLTGYATEDYVDNAMAKTRVWTNTNFASQQWVEDKGYLTEHQSLEGLATEEYVDNAISNIDIPETDLTGYATEEYVNTAINNALSGIATAEGGSY